VANLHEVADVLAVWQDLREILGAKDVTQRRLRKKASRSVDVFNVRDRHSGVWDAVVDDGVDRHRHRVLRQYLSQPNPV